MGHRVNFHWLKSRATTIQRELTNNKDAEIGKHFITSFLRRRNIRMRTKQRSKKKSMTRSNHCNNDMGLSGKGV